MQITDDPVELGAEIRAARKARGWTQAELADAATVSERTVRNLESGKGATTPGTLGLVLRALDREPTTRPDFPEDVAVIVNAIGYTLERLSPAKRADVGAELVRVLMDAAAK